MRQKEEIPSTCIDRIWKFGGDNRDRTDDLLNAIQALSQLSYIPVGGGYDKFRPLVCQY
jgi:hypothetical protein